MSDDGNRHDHPPTAGEQNFSENGSETTENDQSGLPPWAAALTAQVTAQLQASFTAHTPRSARGVQRECTRRPSRERAVAGPERAVAENSIRKLYKNPEFSLVAVAFF